MSSFTRRGKDPALSSQPSPPRLIGYKPWTNGLGLVSCGNRQLDDCIGGGVALGTTLLIELDRLTSYGNTLLLYNLAEGISCSHNCLLLSTATSDDVCNSILAKLPYNLSAHTTSEGEGADLTTTESISQGNDHGLKIAHQYAKYLKVSSRADSSSSSIGGVNGVRYCNSFDLSKPLQSQLLLQTSPSVFALEQLKSSDNYGTLGSLDGILAQWLQEIAGFVKSNAGVTSEASKAISRIFLPDLHTLLAIDSCNDVRAVNKNINKISRFVLSVKQLIRGNKIILCATFSKSHISQMSDFYYAKLFHVSDTVLSIESFAGFVNSVPAEFRDYCGFLLVKKVQQVGVLAPFKSPGTKFGLKRDRRKLNVEPLHLPPEDSRAFPNPASSTKALGLDSPATTTISDAANPHPPASPVAAINKSPYQLAIGGRGAVNISSVNRPVVKPSAGFGCSSNGSGGKYDF